jgi:putative oxidoreductase
VAPILVIIGLFTRAGALVIAINMIVAILLVHIPQFFTFADTGGWALELQGLYVVVAVCMSLLGGGRYSVGGRQGVLN